MIQAELISRLTSAQTLPPPTCLLSCAWGFIKFTSLRSLPTPHHHQSNMSPSIETRLFLSGSFVEPTSPSTFPLYNPSTNSSKVVDVHEAGLEDINRAVDAAKEAQPAWAALSGVERAGKLEKLAQLLERDGAKIGEVSLRSRLLVKSEPLIGRGGCYLLYGKKSSRGRAHAFLGPSTILAEQLADLQISPPPARRHLHGPSRLRPTSSRHPRLSLQTPLGRLSRSIARRAILPSFGRWHPQYGLA